MSEAKEYHDEAPCGHGDPHIVTRSGFDGNEYSRDMECFTCGTEWSEVQG